MDNSETKKQAAMREAERERYLAQLRTREADRIKVKEQSKKAEVNRSEHAATNAQTFLYRMGSRSEFRAGLREKMMADVEQNQDKMATLGQVYRGKLKWFASRYLVKPQDLDKDLE
jgi:hypothetical protein